MSEAYQDSPGFINAAQDAARKPLLDENEALQSRITKAREMLEDLQRYSILGQVSPALGHTQFFEQRDDNGVWLKASDLEQIIKELGE